MPRQAGGKLPGQAGLPRTALPGYQPHPQAPAGRAPLPQLVQFPPRAERDHLGLRTQVPGSTVPAGGTSHCAARIRRYHGRSELLQRGLALFSRLGIPLPPVTRQLPHHRRHEPCQRSQRPRQRPRVHSSLKPQHHRNHNAEHAQRDSPRIDPHRTRMAHNPPPGT